MVCLSPLGSKPVQPVTVQNNTRFTQAQGKNDPIKRLNKHEMDEAAAGVTSGAVLQQTFYFFVSRKSTL